MAEAVLEPIIEMAPSPSDSGHLVLAETAPSDTPLYEELRRKYETRICELSEPTHFSASYPYERVKEAAVVSIAERKPVLHNEVPANQDIKTGEGTVMDYYSMLTEGSVEHPVSRVFGPTSSIPEEYPERYTGSPAVALDDVTSLPAPYGVEHTVPRKRSIHSLINRIREKAQNSRIAHAAAYIGGAATGMALGANIALTYPSLEDASRAATPSVAPLEFFVNAPLLSVGVVGLAAIGKIRAKQANIVKVDGGHTRSKVEEQQPDGFENVKLGDIIPWVA